MQEGREGLEVILKGQKILDRKGLDMRSVTLVVLRFEDRKRTVRCKAYIVLSTLAIVFSSGAEQAHRYTISTNDAATAVKPAVLCRGLLRLLIILWRNSREKCRASAAGFVIHHAKT